MLTVESQDDYGQPQPRDGQHRLRHVWPTLLWGVIVWGSTFSSIDCV